MRRFSTAAAAAILLFTATSFAGYDDCDTRGQSDQLRLTGLACVACGVQSYYAKQGKEVNPSEKWLATLAAGARSFRELNAGEKGGDAESTVREEIARKNMQRVVIAQIQAYNFCTKKVRVEWPVVRKFITNNYDRSKEDVNEVAKVLGFKPGWLTKGNARDAFKNLVEDSEYTRRPINEKRRAFNENANELLSRKDVDENLRDCLNEMKNRAAVENPTDNQSYDLCMTMTASCDIEDSGFCSNGLVLTARSGGSGASTGGSQQNPRPIPASQKPAGGRLPPPPPVQ